MRSGHICPGCRRAWRRRQLHSHMVSASELVIGLSTTKAAVEMCEIALTQSKPSAYSVSWLFRHLPFALVMLSLCTGMA